MIPHSRLFRYILVYVLVISISSMIWEAAQMPLYTLWETGTPWQIIADVLLCTGANIMIASVCLLFAMLISTRQRGFTYADRRTVLATCVFAVGYTVYSEWLNVHVTGAWSYSGLMPTVPGLELGFAPLVQWIVLPTVGLALARRASLSSPRARKDPCRG